MRVALHPARTDLLKDEHDMALFEYYGSADLLLVDLQDPDGTGQHLAPPRLYTE